MEDNQNEEELEDQNSGENEKIHDIVPVSGMYENWFLEYASYVILERAVPAIEDGLKPVQRRIMHSMKEMDDGRFNKVANIIGHSMSYHPHGDAAIGAAIVNLGQKDLLIDTQGNWGDVRTGDGAAAARYIEARLSKFANHVVFNPQTTDWQASYDGRKKEPISLPVKFPLLLAQGVEGIAVGLATKIMPHNFIELVDASIKVLNGKKPKLYPDFLMGGSADFSNYNDGLKGGKIRVRADINVEDKKTLKISSIPFSTTTTSVIDSIIRANDNGKIKIKKVIDNTAEHVEILVDLAQGLSPDQMIDALFAFTDCEVSISPNACVIIDEKPHFIGVSEILQMSTDNTVDLLRKELEIRRAELMEKLLFSSLEKIFIQDEMYIDFKLYDNKKDLFEYLDGRFEKYKPQFYRELKDEDFDKLTQIPMIRITRFDSSKADEKMRNLQDELDSVNHNLANLIEYAISYFEDLKVKFGKGKERKTEICSFETIKANVVAVANEKLYMNAKEGFVGTGLKKDEFVCDCSDIDDIIVFRADGKMIVTKVADKTFVGKNIIYAGVWKKGDERTTYNLCYWDAGSGATMVKRFQVKGVTRDKEYDLTKGVKKSKVWYFSANPNGEAEIITVYLTAGSGARKKVYDYDFSDLDIKGRGAGGNRLSKYPVRKVDFKSKGVSTLSGIKIWYDESIGRLNTDSRGAYLGEFNGDDNIIAFTNDGAYELSTFELSNRYDHKNILLIAKFNIKDVYSCVHYEGGARIYYVKRFSVETTTIGKKFIFISEEGASRLVVVSKAKDPRIELKTKTGKDPKKIEELSLVSLIEVKGWKAMGNKLTNDRVLSVKLLESAEDSEEEFEEAEVVEESDEDSNSAQNEAENEDSFESEKKVKLGGDAKSKAESKKEEGNNDDLNVGDTIDLNVTPKKDSKNSKDTENDQLNLF